ncbi:hypothetical protein GGI26_001493 [Coemansia sp. RSA 1358]|nr:hypothetical protein GGI26_001493 [Coemansia sp. RSA 1358]
MQNQKTIATETTQLQASADVIALQQNSSGYVTPASSSSSTDVSVDPKATKSQQSHLFSWRRLLDPEFYPEVTIHRATFFFIWTIPHIVILAYYASRKKLALTKAMNLASMASTLLDIAAILVFMSPTFLMLLRRTFLPRFITFEKNIHAHKVASYTLVFFSAVHIGIYYNRYIGQAKPRESRGRIIPGVPLINNLFRKTSGWTGHVLLLCLFLIIVTSIKPIRKRLFELFYFIHHLFIVFVAIMFFHHNNRMAYKYLSGPIALYCLDRIFRNLRSAFSNSPIRAVIQHPSGVVEIQFDKKIIGHRPGQFVKVYCPSVSLLQWHPMTISSSPEEELLTIHFRLSGRWTKRLAQRLGCEFGSNSRHSIVQKVVSGMVAVQDGAYFRKSKQRTNANSASYSSHPSIPYHPLHQDPTTRPMYSQSGTNSSYVSIDMVTKGLDTALNASRAQSAELDDNDNDKNKATVTVHNCNPIATQIRSVFPAEVTGNNTAILKMGDELPAIFIDGPYSAPTEHFFEYEVGILIAAGIGVTPAASVLRSIYFRWLHNRNKQLPQRVYLFWVYRDIGTLEWFKDILIALEEEGLSSIVEVRTYFTGDIPETATPQNAHSKDRFGSRIISTSVGTTSYVGRPDFDQIFGAVGQLHSGTRIGTFFCGPKPMARKVRRKAHKWDKDLNKQNKTRLDFHLEVFF